MRAFGAEPMAAFAKRKGVSKASRITMKFLPYGHFNNADAENKKARMGKLPAGHKRGF